MARASSSQGLWRRVAAPLILSLLLPITCGRGETPRRPRNLILVSIDDLAARNTGAYGYERDTTPNLDLLADEGTLFEKAYVQQAWTLTSHLSMLTGVYPAVHGATLNQPARPNVPTLAEQHEEHGFATAGFVGLGGCLAPEYGMGRGFDHCEIGVGDAPEDNKSRFAWLEEQARLGQANPAGKGSHSLVREGGDRKGGLHGDGMLRGWRTGKSQLIAEVNGERWAYVAAVLQRSEGEEPVFEAAEPYMLGTDPDQRHDLAAERPERARALRDRLIAWFEENERVARSLGVWVPDSRVLSEEEKERLRALGYAP